MRSPLGAVTDELGPLFVELSDYTVESSPSCRPIPRDQGLRSSGRVDTHRLSRLVVDWPSSVDRHQRQRLSK